MFLDQEVARGLVDREVHQDPVDLAFVVVPVDRVASRVYQGILFVRKAPVFKVSLFLVEIVLVRRGMPQAMALFLISSCPE